MRHTGMVLAILMALVLVAPTGAALTDEVSSTVDDTVETVKDTVDSVLDKLPLDDELEDTTDHATDKTDDATDSVPDDVSFLTEDPTKALRGDPVGILSVDVAEQSVWDCRWLAEGHDDEHFTDCAADGSAANRTYGQHYSVDSAAFEGDMADVNVTLVDTGPEEISRAVTVSILDPAGDTVAKKTVVIEAQHTVYSTTRYDEACDCYVPSRTWVESYKDWKTVTFEDVPLGGHDGYSVETSAAPVGQDTQPLPWYADYAVSEDQTALFGVHDAEPEPTGSYNAGTPSGVGPSNLAAVAAIGIVGTIGAGAVALRRWL